jgi:excisionase family DNA binding protein
MQKNTPPAPEGLRLCVGVDEAATALSLGRTRIYELVRDGKLKSFTVGGRRLFRVADIEAFVAEASRHAA